jgi:hypothetical protein
MPVPDTAFAAALRPERIEKRRSTLDEEQGRDGDFDPADEAVLEAQAAA